jgi:membrane-bound metal-dependent hydrolase YbcI (DUF457 family)
MPSPLAHLSAGYAVFKMMEPGSPYDGQPLLTRQWLALGAAMFFSILPDFDSLAGFATGDLGKYHNNLTHSFAVAAGVALSVALLARAFRARRPGFWTAFGILCYLAHLAMDYFTWGRGLMLFWPLTSRRFGPPVYLFYGLHWSEGLFSRRHVWTVLTESGFVVAAIVGAHLVARRRRQRLGAQQRGPEA